MIARYYDYFPAEDPEPKKDEAKAKPTPEAEQGAHIPRQGPTPRTDQAHTVAMHEVVGDDYSGAYKTMAEFARELESENAQLRAALNEVAYMAERLCEPNEISDYARGLTA